MDYRRWNAKYWEKRITSKHIRYKWLFNTILVAQMDDVAIKLTCQGYLCVCDIYLDGLDESQTKLFLTY